MVGVVVVEGEEGVELALASLVGPALLNLLFDFR